MTETEIVTEYGGFVQNLETAEWECLFVTEISALIAHNRALEKAIFRNESAGRAIYNMTNVWVRQRHCTKMVGEWTSPENAFPTA